MRRSRIGAAATAVALASLLGCGSTIQGQGGSSSELSVGGEPGAGGTTAGPLGAGGQPGAGTGSTAGNGATSGAGGATGSSGQLAGGGGVGGSSLANNSPLLIGVPDERNAAAANGSIGAGAQNSDPGNFKADYTALVNYINKHGGVAGHPLKPIFYQFDATSTQSFDQQAQAACDRWTHDFHVFAIFLAQSDVLKACAAKAGILLISGEESSTDGPGFARYPGLVEITSVGLDRVGPATVNGLNRLRYFAGLKSSQLGLVTWDLPQFHHAIDNGYVPALQQLGLNVPTTHRRFLHVAQSANDVAQTSNAARAAAFKFASDGVTHVLLLDGAAGISGGGLLHLEFMLNAEALHYRPIYGLNGTSLFSNESATYPKAQQHGALGVGWRPSSDQAPADDPPSHYSAPRKHCLEIFAQADLAATSTDSAANQIRACDQLFFLQLVASRVSGPLSTSAFMNAVAHLGSSFAPAGTFATSFAGRRDGAAQGQNLVFVDSCTCYRYVGTRFGI